MNTKEAWQLVGGLSKPSKMPGWSIGIPAKECKTGAKLRLIPNSVCEAMLCGCLPIGSRVFGIPDIIGNTGILFDTEKDLDQIKDYIMLDTGEKESKFARNRIISKFDISRRTEKIKENID